MHPTTLSQLEKLFFLQPTLLVGSPGTAKTNIMTQFLRSAVTEQTIFKIMNFSSLTTPGMFQLAVEVELSWICTTHARSVLAMPKRPVLCVVAAGKHGEEAGPDIRAARGEVHDAVH